MSDRKGICYKSGFKYQLVDDYEDILPIKPKDPIATPYVVLNSSGYLKIRSGYAWDGPSGPTVDSKNFMRGSLVHDVLYELMRKDLLPRTMKGPADELLKAMCKEDGMWSLRAWWVKKGLWLGGKAATLSRNRKKIISAPRGFSCGRSEEE
jgi:hypothetical protein